ncbi:hypothetical protein A1O3_05681 [Capronia epimyces CBS 606.96]|uniref:DNA polymerase lambda n=1 Tax=Capronia epimyces CBS 606.96 TaxID=1182542 RepID=W9Y6Z6_9EURO|nr:uncharacterized protein A1O3_05681 [Capronia epimyces CBS 606.96]EXJ85006.1 hypothetical protein A1O3_05681 [Capronia epimyces CBS 606.96]
MASTQEKVEKDRFFRDLYLLDSLDEDLPDSEVDSPIKPVKESTRRPERTLTPTPHEGTKQVAGKSKSHDQDPGPIPRATEAVTSNSKKSKTPLPFAPVKGQTQTLVEKRKRVDATELKPRARHSETVLSRIGAAPNIKRVKASSPVNVDAADHNSKNARERHKHVTDLSNIKQRKRQLGSKKLPPVPTEQQMFRGLTFFFVPNNDICQARRFRIHKAIQYGAAWANEWCNEVTHIIVCENLDVKEASKEFAYKEIPNHPSLVNVNWLIECLSRKIVCETHWNRFQVPGFESGKAVMGQPSPKDSRPELGHRPRSDATRLRVAEEPARRSERHHFAVPTPEEEEIARLNEETRSEDELDNAIKDVRSIGSLPLDLSVDENAKSLSDESEIDQTLAILPGDGKARKGNSRIMCMAKHDGSNDDNPNAQTIDKLLKMADYYAATGDQWRTRAYRQAVTALRKQTQVIRTKQEALALRGIGERIAEKIQEIVSTGRLQRLDNAQMDSRDKILRLFMGIYQVGYPTASRWIAEGHRTLEDLYQKVDLNRNQRIGIEHYDDFQQRIPRAEVAQHAAIVKKELEAADAGLQMIIGGSYRRGSADCGDIDILIFKKHAGLDHIRTLMMGTVIPRLTEQGFLKVALASSHHEDSGSKWHGASALQGSKVWRRIDLLFVPWAELGAALIYFTGNEYFNRSLRLHASRKQMRLNQHGLYADVMRGPGRERLADGRLLEGHDEKRIFEVLGVTYRPPEHRNP